ncbi:MAG: 50S ribosomal protein L36 [Rickettsiales bacterium]|jgi:ribosomal protein L36|nr:50S ribosomal protein L36 [Rickettsiales bacterium]
MKKVASLRSSKIRDKNCKIIKRKKTRGDGSKKSVTLVINKKNPRFKASQG